MCWEAIRSETQRRRKDRATTTGNRNRNKTSEINSGEENQQDGRITGLFTAKRDITLPSEIGVGKAGEAGEGGKGRGRGGRREDSRRRTLYHTVPAASGDQCDRDNNGPRPGPLQWVPVVVLMSGDNGGLIRDPPLLVTVLLYTLHHHATQSFNAYLLVVQVQSIMQRRISFPSSPERKSV